MRNSSVVALLMALVMACVGCSGDKSGKPKVTVSIPPQKYLLEQIAGDKVEIVTLMDAGTNPETYQPTMSTMGDLEASMLYLTVGTLPFEREMERRLTANGSDLTVVDTSKGVPLLHGTHGDCEHGHGDHDHGAGDPHIWSSVANARIMAQNMADALIKADASNADYYRQNLRRLDLRLDSLDNAYRARLDASGAKAFVILHPSLSYLANDYDLEQIAVGQEGKESTVNAQRERIDDARRHRAKVMFVQQEFDSRQSATLAEEIGANTVSINPMNEDWQGEMEKVINALTIYE